MSALREVYISEALMKDKPKKQVGLVLRSGAVIGTGEFMSPITNDQINQITK